MTEPLVESIVLPFYQQALTVNTQANPAEVLERVLANTFQSINSQETGARQGSCRLIHAANC